MQGTGDNFYKQGQLLPENFSGAAKDAGYDEMQVRVRAQEGYDHSYFFVSNNQSYHQRSTRDNSLTPSNVDLIFRD
jgi:S-formylglutathione hydrolase